MFSKAGLDHTAREEFENEGPTLKTHQLFSVHSTPEELENARINYNLPSFTKSFSKKKFQDDVRSQFIKMRCFLSSPSRTLRITLIMPRAAKTSVSWLEENATTGNVQANF